MPVMMLGTFPTFLTFLTRKLCLPAIGSAPWLGLEISSCLRRGPLRRPGLRSRWRRPGRLRMTVLDTETEVTVSTRRRLPNRREHELIDFEHGGIRYTAGIGRFNNGALAEIFLNTGNAGTAVDTNARDAAVAASLLLQHRCSVDTLRRALTRNGDGSASGPLARVLDLLAGGI